MDHLLKTLIFLAEPSMSLQAVQTMSSGEDTTLVCSAYDFYPKNIRIAWYQNGQEVTSGVTLSDVMTNGDWTYHVHSYLQYTPGQYDTITCVVEHASLKEPKISAWGEEILRLDQIVVDKTLYCSYISYRFVAGSSFSESEKSSLIGGIFALVFGASFLSFGLFHYRRKSCDPRLSNAL